MRLRFAASPARPTAAVLLLPLLLGLHACSSASRDHGALGTGYTVGVAPRDVTLQPPLQERSLPAGHREIRIRADYGWGSGAALRVTTDGHRTRGELFVGYWAGTMVQADSARHAKDRRDQARERARLQRAYGCRRFEPAGDDDERFCRVPFRRGQPDWGRVLRELDSLGVGEPTVPQAAFGSGACTEGQSADVEVRSGARYGRYRFYVCGAGVAWDVERAAALVQLVRWLDLVAQRGPRAAGPRSL
jgi:hypothetical protein